MMNTKFYKVIAFYLLGTGVGWAQQDSVDLFSLSLEELMNIEIVSASKKAESLFDAPLSASVLTAEEIRNAGSTSIMEALRLIPGVIVREQTNGNYDVHVRGLDNVPPNSLMLSSTNTTTLVMINNRPVYNYLQGGTFWESLPIDLNDVERIEVVRGPSSTLYGPNAASGVINIITKQTDKDGWSVNGSSQFGSKSTAINNIRAAYQVNEKWSVALSGNHQNRGRDNLYINYETDEYVPAEELPLDNINERYPHPDKSMIKSGVNAFINYTPKEKSQFALTAGLQDSEVQNSMFDNSHSLTVINTNRTKSQYVDFLAVTHGFTTQVSHTQATQSPVLGEQGKYDYAVTDANVEYDFTIKNLSVKPGVTYRGAAYDDSAYERGILNGKKTMETFGGSVRLDYQIIPDKLRLTGGLRADKFTYPDDVFLSYQGAANYKINKKNLIRAVYSKAYRSAFIFDTYLEIKMNQPIGNNMFIQASALGNKQLDLLNSRMFEIGYRSTIMKNLSVDIEVYNTTTENYTALVQGPVVPTPQNYPVVATTTVQMENIPLSVEQQGVSLSFNYVLNKLQVKPFVTFQKTSLKDYSPYFNTTDAPSGAKNNFDPANNNVNSGLSTETDHKFTPKHYGGAYINYALNKKFNFNVSAYWFGKQTFYVNENLIYNDGIHGVGNIDSKVLLNATISYAPIKQIRIFVNGRNLTNNKSLEYYDSDKTNVQLYGGVNFGF
jgi:iron complex outermembrane recepter protein